MIGPNDVMRYLGVKIPYEPLLDAARRAIDACGAAAEFRAVAARYPVAIHKNTADIAGLAFASEYLVQQLNGASEALVFCCTLGAGADRFLTSTGSMDVGFACVVNAALDAMLTASLAGWVGERNQELQGEGLGLLPRVCPGYGDWTLKDVDRLLPLADARHIGVCATSGHMLLPAKSLIGVYGIAQRHELACPKSACEGCAHPCSYREEA